MKKTITQEVEVDICDNCNEQAGLANICFACGYCSCWTCSEKVMTKFFFGVHCSGWADGYYCKPCDAKLAESKSDALHNAYVAVWQLREEEKRWYADFEKRKRVAEAKTEDLYKAFRAATPRGGQS